MRNIVSDIEWRELSQTAWNARENAYILASTKVGAAVITNAGQIYYGCNVQHNWRHDTHAEQSAITAMVSNTSIAIDHPYVVKAILIVAEREKFTPCGSCMDWIFQFGGPDCIVGFQSSKNSEIVKFNAVELMPHYPH